MLHVVVMSWTFLCLLLWEILNNLISLGLDYQLLKWSERKCLCWTSNNSYVMFPSNYCTNGQRKKKITNACMFASCHSKCCKIKSEDEFTCGSESLACLCSCNEFKFKQKLFVELKCEEWQQASRLVGLLRELNLPFGDSEVGDRKAGTQTSSQSWRL